MIFAFVIIQLQTPQRFVDSSSDYCVTVLFRLRGTLTRPGLSDEDGRYGHHQSAAALPDLEQSGSKHLCSGGFLNSGTWNNLSPP